MFRDMFRLGLSGPTLGTSLDQLHASGLFGEGAPDTFTIDDKKARFVSFEKASQQARRDITARWHQLKPDYAWLAWNRGIVKGARYSAEIGIRSTINLLSRLDFELCSMPSMCDSWGRSGASYEGPSIGFSDGHWNHGWMCAFKGKGHDRLVSRRWLDYGPWRLIRDETHDLSIVQFHDLNADDETALAQAKPGHERMGISETGGFIQTDFVWEHQSGASYDPVNQTLLYVVYGRTVSQEEMLEAAAVKLWQPLAKPVKQVAYVFMDEKAARAHLHEAWLHNVEVRTFINGAEVILTETYDPPAPKVPDWVKRLQDQEGK